MNFFQAVRSGFRNYSSATGRASRSEFWYWRLFEFLGGMVTGVIDGALMLHAGQQELNIVSSVFGLVCLLPSINVTIRRLHDLNRSGWWLLLWITISAVLSVMLHVVGIIIAVAIAIIACCFRGSKGDNRFGSDPLAQATKSSLREVLMLIVLILAICSLSFLFPNRSPSTYGDNSEPMKVQASDPQSVVLQLNEEGKQVCNKTMTDFAKKNGNDPKQYIATNQAYLQKCIKYLVEKEQKVLNDGNAAYDRGDYQTVLKLEEPLADQGNLIAQENIGNMYMEGKGVKQDYAKAMSWYRKAAEHEYVDAVPLVNIGIMYHEGWGIKRDFAEAIKWYHKAADQGDRLGQANIGMMYEQGEGVTQDNVQAYMWYDLAKADNKDDIARKMTPVQITEAKRLASMWKPAPVQSSTSER